MLTFTLHASSVTFAVDSTINSALTNRNAYGANIGWVDWRADTTNGVVLGEFVLRGYAYGANIGWINFETLGNARIDLVTGKFSGYAYSANCGWISLSNAFAVLKTDSCVAGADSDVDGIADAWERTYAGNLGTLTATGDADGDGIPDKEEYGADTNPLDASDNLRITAISAMPLGSPATLTWTSKPTRLYQVQSRDSMLAGGWVTNSPPGLVSPDLGLTTTRDTTGSVTTQRFFRVQSLKPLSP